MKKHFIALTALFNLSGLLIDSSQENHKKRAFVRMISAYLLIISSLFFSSGCAAMNKVFGMRSFQPDVVDTFSLKTQRIEEIAKRSSYFEEFLSQIYVFDVSKKRPVVLGTTGNDPNGSPKSTSNFTADMTVIKEYCKAKNGNSYTWSYTSRPITTCEINKVVIAAAGVTNQRGPASARIADVWIHNQNQFSNYLENQATHNNSFCQYKSGDRSIQFYRMYNDTYQITVQMHNKTQKPVNYNLLNSLAVIDGTEYSIDFGKIKYPYKNIYGEIFDISKINLNPGEKKRYSFDVIIGGTNEITDLTRFGFRIDNKIKVSSLIETNVYELNKISL